MSLSGKVAAVTGGGSGIGEATCVRLAAEGARVAVIDIDESAAGLTAKLAGEGLAVVADVSDSAAVDAALEQVEAELGPVDVWVNNAGISGGAHSDRVNPRAEQQLAQLGAGEEVTTALDALVRMSDEEWARMLDVHLNGTFYGTRAAARSMAARGAGVIVNVASICGIEGCTGHPHYSAAKGGILAFTRIGRQRADPAGGAGQRDRPRLRRHPAGQRLADRAAGRRRGDGHPAGPARPPRGDRGDDRLPRRR